MSGNGGSSTGGRYVAARREIPPALGFGVSFTGYLACCAEVNVRDVNGRKAPPPWFWRDYAMMNGYKYRFGATPAGVMAPVLLVSCWYWGVKWAFA